MTIKLNVKERWLLRRVFAPRTISLVDNDLWDDIAQKTKFTPEEVERIDGMIPPSPEKNFSITIELSRDQIRMLQKQVSKINDEGTIPYDMDDDSAINLAKKILNLTV